MSLLPTHPSAHFSACDSAALAMVRQAPLNACPDMPMLGVVTVNRVQTTYQVPIYETQCHVLAPAECKQHGGEGTSGDVVDLERKRRTGYSYDLVRYRRRRFVHSSVHISEVNLRTGDCPASPKLSDPPTPTATTIEGAELHVSVLMPVYNGERWIHDALQSVLAAMATSAVLTECIIVDDGSTDNTLHAVRALIGDRTDCVVVECAHGGITTALNEGLRHCHGEFVARMDADDIMLAGRLDMQARTLHAFPELTAVGSNMALFPAIARGNELPSDTRLDGPLRKLPKVLKCVTHPNEPALVRWALFFRCCIAHPTTMIRASDLKACGGYGGPAGVEDYDLWLKLAFRRGGIANLPGVTTLYRKHDKNASSTTKVGADCTVVGEAMQRCLGRHVPPRTVHTMQHPNVSERGVVHVCVVCARATLIRLRLPGPLWGRRRLHVPSCCVTRAFPWRCLLLPATGGRNHGGLSRCLRARAGPGTPGRRKWRRIREARRRRRRCSRSLGRGHGWTQGKRLCVSTRPRAHPTRRSSALG